MSQHGDCPELGQFCSPLFCLLPKVRSVALLPLGPKVTAWVDPDA